MAPVSFFSQSTGIPPKKAQMLQWEVTTTYVVLCPINDRRDKVFTEVLLIIIITVMMTMMKMWVPSGSWDHITFYLLLYQAEIFWAWQQGRWTSCVLAVLFHFLLMISDPILALPLLPCISEHANDRLLDKNCLVELCFDWLDCFTLKCNFCWLWCNYIYIL